LNSDGSTTARVWQAAPTAQIAAGTASAELTVNADIGKYDGFDDTISITRITL
jgi:hypothetical protein